MDKRNTGHTFHSMLEKTREVLGQKTDLKSGKQDQLLPAQERRAGGKLLLGARGRRHANAIYPWLLLSKVPI